LRWSDLSQFAIGSNGFNAGEAALSVFDWALRTASDFYGDAWFEAMADKREIPFSAGIDNPGSDR
jgi:hypothetical protein